MALAEVPTAVQRVRRDTAWPPPRAVPASVMVIGEQDISNEMMLAADLARGIAAHDDDVVVDLQGVTFMGASTIGVLVTAQKFLADRGRQLIVRSPSPCARHLLAICDLTTLIDDRPFGSAASTG